MRRDAASTGAADLIRDAIVGGELQPGERLKEEELGRMLGISRTPVREALLILRTEGLVEATPSGAIVRTYSTRDLENLYGMRAVLEAYAARRAAVRLTRRDLRRLDESSQRFLEAATNGGDVQTLVDENVVFHDTILDAADDPRLSAMVRNVTALPLVYRTYLWLSPAQRAASAHDHVQLTKVFRLRDGERAELIMKEHLLKGRDVLVEHAGAAAGGEPRAFRN